MQDYLGAVIVLAAAVASIGSLPSDLLSKSLVGLGLTYALTVRFRVSAILYRQAKLHDHADAINPSAFCVGQ